jgi:hypothetical protein
MGLAFDPLFSILEGRPAVIRPSHFKTHAAPFTPLTAQSFSERPVRFEVFNEFPYGELEAPLVFGRESCVIPLETVRLPVSRQAFGLQLRLEGLEEIVV